MTERFFKNNRSLVMVILLLYACTNIKCAIQTRYFITKPTLNNMICADAERIFEVSVRSKVMCSKMCDDSVGCWIIFYEPVSRACTTCSGKSDLKGKNGTLGYVRNISVNCGSLPSVEGVDITSVDGYTFGDMASYTCTSCSHTPANGVGVITCQADGTWTTPTCAPAIDVGYLPNGQEIPNGAKGCVSTGGSTCLSPSLSAHVSNGLRSNGDFGKCWCGKLCCTDMSFCCYDVKC